MYTATRHFVGTDGEQATIRAFSTGEGAGKYQGIWAIARRSISVTPLSDEKVS